jgi:glycosyltransferase involved in cell wall biosynthesis
MAAGLPVIATDSCGCADDLIRDGVTGLLVPTADPASLTAALARLVGASAERARMGDAARALIRPWTLDQAAINTIQAWGEAVA